MFLFRLNHIRLSLKTQILFLQEIDFFMVITFPIQYPKEGRIKDNNTGNISAGPLVSKLPIKGNK